MVGDEVSSPTNWSKSPVNPIRLRRVADSTLSLKSSCTLSIPGHYVVVVFWIAAAAVPDGTVFTALERRVFTSAQFYIESQFSIIVQTALPFITQFWKCLDVHELHSTLHHLFDFHLNCLQSSICSNWFPKFYCLNTPNNFWYIALQRRFFAENIGVLRQIVFKQ